MMNNSLKKIKWKNDISNETIDTHTHTPSLKVVWRCGRQRHVGKNNWCDIPVKVLVSVLQTYLGRLGCGQKHVVIHNGYPAIGGGEKERAKLLQEFLVQVLRLSRSDGPVARLIGAATAPGTQLAWCLACPYYPVTVETTGASVHIVCAGASVRTAAPSCRGRWGRAC